MLLYRFVDLPGFVSMIAEDRMFLRQVTAWPDPYETDALSKLIGEVLEKTHLAIREPSPAPSPKITALRKAIRDAIFDLTLGSIYAQSWTELPDSDALWRIYSPDRRGIRIAVERDALRTQIARTFPHVDHFKVEYCAAEVARTQLLHRFRESDSSVQLTACCRYKRREFAHEQEYRFCIAQNPPGYEDIDLESVDYDKESDLKSALDCLRDYHYQQVKPYDFDPTMIKEITLDPRLDPEKDGWFEKAIRNLCKVKGMRSLVNRSDLYKREEARNSQLA